MKNLILFPAVLFFAFLFSCTKEGPAGPAGSSGINSTNFIVMPSDWQQISSYSCTSGCNYVNIVDTAITADILSTGAVWVYWVTDSAGRQYQSPLPVTVNSIENQVMKCTSSLGTEEIYLENLDLSYANQTFRIVTLSSQMFRTHPELNRQA